MPGKKKNWQPAGHSGSVSFCPFRVVSQTALFPRSSHLTSLRCNLIHSDTQAAAIWHCSPCCADDRYLFFLAFDKWWKDTARKQGRPHYVHFCKLVDLVILYLRWASDGPVGRGGLRSVWGVLLLCWFLLAKNLLHTSKRICSKSNVFSPPSSSFCYKKMWVREVQVEAYCPVQLFILLSHAHVREEYNQIWGIWFKSLL